MDQGRLFDGERPEGANPAQPLPPRIGAKRMRHAVRNQVEFQPCSLDELLPDEHKARIVWAYVCGLDLSGLHQRIQAVEDGPGQAPAEPRIFMALWLYATLRGVGSAGTEPVVSAACGLSLDLRRCVDELPHPLRLSHAARRLLDRLLTQGVAGLMHEGLVEMERVAQDGMRVRASAGAASFRRRETLEKCLAEAKEQVRRLRAELQSDPAAANQRQKAARQRAARERLERVQKALQHLPELEARRKPKEREKTRVSTTDAEATVMKMGDGGYRPAYNVQLATDTATQIITGVDAVTTGGDQGQLAPMVEQHAERYQQTPEAMLVDGGFVRRKRSSRSARRKAARWFTPR